MRGLLIGLLLLSGCAQGNYLTREEFAAYAAENKLVLLRMAELHAISSELHKVNSERLDILERGDQSHARTY